MQCLVDGNPLSVRSLNFSPKWWDPQANEVAYQVLIPLLRAALWLEGVLPEYIAHYPDGSNQLESLLRQRNWPAVREACQDEEVLVGLLRLFAFDLLLEMIGDAPACSRGYILNSVDLVEQRTEQVGFSGRAYCAIG